MEVFLAALGEDPTAYDVASVREFAAQRLGIQPSAHALEQLDTPLVLAFLDDLESTRGN